MSKWMWKCRRTDCNHRGTKPTDRSTAGHNGRKHMKTHGVNEEPIYIKVYSKEEQPDETILLV